MQGPLDFSSGPSFFSGSHSAPSCCSTVRRNRAVRPRFCRAAP